MWEELIDWVTRNELGSIASVFALIITIVGFIVTIINVRKARKAAERAETAAEKVKGDIIKLNTVADFSSAISAMSEIKRLHRQEAWGILPDRYSALRKSLISIKGLNPDMLDEYKATIQSAIQNFASIEDSVERAIANKQPPPDIARLNRVISKHIDKLDQILVEIKNTIGG